MKAAGNGEENYVKSVFNEYNKRGGSKSYEQLQDKL